MIRWSSCAFRFTSAIAACTPCGLSPRSGKGSVDRLSPFKLLLSIPTYMHDLLFFCIRHTTVLYRPSLRDIISIFESMSPSGKYLSYCPSGKYLSYSPSGYHILSTKLKFCAVLYHQDSGSISGQCRLSGDGAD